jgi:hypothetical protein
MLAALQDALAAEQAACYGYGVAGAHLIGAQYTQASDDWITHQRVRDQLTVIITERGAQPHPAAAAYRLPFVIRTPAQATSLAITLEHQVTAAYLGMVGLADPALRTFGARNMQAAAVRAARWNARSQAFPGLRTSALEASHHSSG